MQLSRAAGKVLELVFTHPSRPLVIALDGPSAAGTSTLALAVGQRLSASVVAGDDFYRDGRAPLLRCDPSPGVVRPRGLRRL